jgi:hypothetical protein
VRLTPAVAILTLSIATLAVDKAQPLKVRLGLWEVTTTVTTSSDMPIPAAILEKLTPEQRARIEERMKARKSDPQKTTIMKQCLTRRELERGVPFRRTQKSCSWTVIHSTSSKVEMRGYCIDQGVKKEGTLRIEALSPEAAEGSVQFSTNENVTHGLASTFKAKWIGPSCKDF